ncbi:MAG: DUF4426 domain-containing protein [Thiohalophilus sp.]|jgi:hypothetical protein
MWSLLKWSLTSLLVLSFYPATAGAEQAKQVDNYVIHYNVLNTDMLTPDIAKQYGIQRSKSRAMLNVAVIRSDDKRPVSAMVTATTGMMTGHMQKLSMREIREGEAIYYIGDFPVAHLDTLNFTIKVKPEGSQQTHTIEFKKQFFTK